MCANAQRVNLFVFYQLSLDLITAKASFSIHFFVNSVRSFAKSVGENRPFK